MRARTVEELSASFSEICRVCLAKAPKLQSLFSDNTLPRNSALIGEVIMVCASVQIKENDGLPSHICKKCMLELQRALKFKLLCETSDTELRRQLAEVQPKIKVCDDRTQNCTRQCHECKIKSEDENPAEINFKCHCQISSASLDGKKSVKTELSEENANIPQGERVKSDFAESEDEDNVREPRRITHSAHFTSKEVVPLEKLPSKVKESRSRTHSTHSLRKEVATLEKLLSKVEKTRSVTHSTHSLSKEAATLEKLLLKVEGTLNKCESTESLCKEVETLEKLLSKVEETHSLRKEVEKTEEMSEYCLIDQSSMCFRPPGMPLQCMCHELDDDVSEEEVKGDAEDLKEEDSNDGWMKLERARISKVDGKAVKAVKAGGGHKVKQKEVTLATEMSRIIKSKLNIKNLYAPASVEDHHRRRKSTQCSVQSDYVDVESESSNKEEDAVSTVVHYDNDEVSIDEVFVDKKQDTCGDKITRRESPKKQTVRAYYPTGKPKRIINPHLPVKTVYMCHEIKNPTDDFQHVDSEIRGKIKDPIPLETLYISTYKESSKKAKPCCECDFTDSNMSFCTSLSEDIYVAPVTFLEAKQKISQPSVKSNNSKMSPKTLSPRENRKAKCDESFALNTHKKETHPTSYQCNICGSKFTAYYALAHHKRLHNNYCPYKCSVCSRTFMTSGKLSVHKRMHKDGQHLNPRKAYMCDLCFATFCTEKELKAHRAAHKPFKCQVCGNRFRFKSNLMEHMKCHPDLRFKCNVHKRNFDGNRRTSHEIVH